MKLYQKSSQISFQRPVEVKPRIPFEAIKPYITGEQYVAFIARVSKVEALGALEIWEKYADDSESWSYMQHCKPLLMCNRSKLNQ